MAIREIVTVPAPVLRRKARKVTEFDDELQSLIDDMVDTMREAPGVGLAAPQVGIPLRVIVIEFSEELERAASASEPVDANPPAQENDSSLPDQSNDTLSRQVEEQSVEPQPVELPQAEAQQVEYTKKPPKLYTMVNPELTRISSSEILGVEGCLSIPGFAGEVNRPVEITVRGQNRRGQPMKVKAKDWLARIFLHEIDHLEGVLFTDLAERVWKLEEGEEPPLD